MTSGGATGRRTSGRSAPGTSTTGKSSKRFSRNSAGQQLALQEFLGTKLSPQPGESPKPARESAENSQGYRGGFGYSDDFQVPTAEGRSAAARNSVRQEERPGATTGRTLK